MSSSKRRSLEDDRNNYYQLLGVKPSASLKEIASAYRGLALRHHPDKSSSSESVERFHELTRAYQILTDDDARCKFDAVLVGRQARAQREAALSMARKEMRDDLLQREREARRRKAEEQAAQVKLQQEMERIRRETPDKSESRHHIHTDVPVFDTLDRTIKVSSKDGTMDEGVLGPMLSCYGVVDSIVVSKKRTSGLVQMKDVQSAKNIMVDSSLGKLASSWTFSWAKGNPPVVPVEDPDTAISDRDFESLTIMRMRQHAERAKLRSKLDHDNVQQPSNIREKM